MRKYIQIVGLVFVGILLFLYLAFLFIIPNVININTYKNDIQKLVKENTNLELDFDNIKVITSPFLEAGIKVYDPSIKLPDESELFHADLIKLKVFLPSLIRMSLRISCAQVENPRLNIDIQKDGEQFKVSKSFEDYVNKKRQDKLHHPEKYAQPEESLPFDVSKIKVYIPSLKLNNYQARINDLKENHFLMLKGNKLVFAYKNGDTAKIKTDAVLYSDEKENITANIDIDSVLPQFEFSEKEEEDLEAVYSIPFVNPVSTYRNYDLKSNISSKLKIRRNNRNANVKINGFLNIENTTVTLSGLQLPESHFRLKSHGYNSEIDSNLYVTDKEFINLSGKINHGYKKFLDLNIKSSRVYLSNLLKIAKAYLNTIHLKTDVENMAANGYFQADAAIKTNFESLESDGAILIRDANISDSNIGLLFNDIRANLIFDRNKLKLRDSHILINNSPLDISGTIGSDSSLDIDIKGQKIPLPPLYKAFAPKDIKRSYNMDSGDLSINAKVNGNMKNVIAIIKSELRNFKLLDAGKSFAISNEYARFGLINYSGIIRGRLHNNGFML